jgi:hypothetical protein
VQFYGTQIIMSVQDHVVVVFVSMQEILENNLEKFCQLGPTDQSVCVLHSNRITQFMRQCKIMNLGLSPKQGLDVA